MVKACIPVAIQVVIDDVGWWSGEDSSKQGGPFRTGIHRNHVVDDYRAIVELGRRLGMRPQAAMILCEWDRENILRELPSSTWMGEKWDNKKWTGPWLDEAAEVIRNGKSHMEFTLHGVGHEFWDGPNFTRAEWHEKDGKMRPEREVVAHLEYYTKIMEQNQLGTFPESFVPAAFVHEFGRGEEGIVPILKKYGIKYISTPYRSMYKSREPEGDFFGVDCGVITVDRGSNTKRIPPWYEFESNPCGEIIGPICGLHWPNVLHSDPERNSEAVDRWVGYLSEYNKRFDKMLAANTAESFSQVVYNWGTCLDSDDSTLYFDFSKLSGISAAGLLDSFYIKVEAGLKIKSVSEGLEAEVVGQPHAAEFTLLRVTRRGGCTGGKVEFIRDR